VFGAARPVAVEIAGAGHDCLPSRIWALVRAGRSSHSRYATGMPPVLSRKRLSEGFDRHGVPPLHRPPDRGPAAGGVDALFPLNLLDLAGQVLVLDALAEPLRILMGVQMVHPRLLIDAVGELQERHQIAGPQVQLALRPAEVEAALLVHAALGVFADVAAALGVRRPP